ncbi:tRNA (adenosine(37)-N6)-threonylcarbamoyltransferase complex transferase subunit TsaD [Candidatus Nardonella dryophthoridicola]|uniref:N(6)-L-threonylcarbamoyladenine synthase n=1 Tax=endosymbiont of Metamasius hemipterus TaxID=204627 RepID=A0ABT0TWA1_9GAMM|nr:tRNA (adenosine(37)-N6)-threonylcarbamoyltransferase complex transferase subunit TsaD [Candidatus Nardonella dryophthoridicola]MCM0158276.1 tRNA (adenosine(37)-N6)-threonylcarbamoyltransferase complex transferase subunit TsaD [endosymbiont of Metamasius hemipterus]
MKILGIETSFDDTCISIIDDKKGILINKIINNNKIYNKYNGIIPEIVSNYHIKKIDKLLKNILLKLNINIKKISLISYTCGPGLISSLSIGASYAKSLSYLLKIPSIPINHLEGHLLSPMINNNNIKKKIKFPFIGLIISGANTQLIKATNFDNYKIIGQTLDNAIGETYDKIAKLLNINYPGAKKLVYYSNKGKNNIYNFPKPLIKKDNLNFSFSGLITYINNLIKKIKNINIQDKYNIAKEFENSIIKILQNKILLSIKKYNIYNIFISGGVSINNNIIKNIIKLKIKNKKIFFYS